MEVGDDSRLSAAWIKELGEMFRTERVVGCTDGAVGEGVDADEAGFEVSVSVFVSARASVLACAEVLAENSEGAERLAGGNVAGGGENVIWVFIAGEAIKAGAAVCELEGGVVGVDPARFIGFIKCCNIYNVFRAAHKFIGGFGGNVVSWKETVYFSARDIKERRDECG